jgi:hypothetical protein
MLGNDKLEDLHIHERIILKVKDEAVPGLRHKGIYERLTSRPGRSTPRKTPRHSSSRWLDGHQSSSELSKKRKFTLCIRTLDVPGRSLVSLLATPSWFPEIITKIDIKETAWKDVKSIHMAEVASQQQAHSPTVTKPGFPKKRKLWQLAEWLHRLMLLEHNKKCGSIRSNRQYIRLTHCTPKCASSPVQTFLAEKQGQLNENSYIRTDSQWDLCTSFHRLLPAARI